MMTELENKTMENRMHATYDLHWIMRLAESEMYRVQNIPLLDDEEHADWVQGFTDRIHEIRFDMENLAKFGHRKE